MIVRGFTVFDKKAECYARPFWVGTEAEALRMFQDEANDRESAIGKHPEDYALFSLGLFNLVTGITTMHEEPKHVSWAHHMVKGND